MSKPSSVIQISTSKPSTVTPATSRVNTSGDALGLSAAKSGSSSVPPLRSFRSQHYGAARKYGPRTHLIPHERSRKEQKPTRGAHPPSQRPETPPLLDRRRSLLRQPPPFPSWVFETSHPFARGPIQRCHSRWSIWLRLMRFLPTNTGKKLSNFKWQWQSFNQSVYHHSRLSKPLALIVQIYEAVNLGTISHEQLLQSIDEALFRNLDVTIGGVS